MIFYLGFLAVFLLCNCARSFRADNVHQRVAGSLPSGETNGCPSFIGTAPLPDTVMANNSKAAALVNL